MGARVTFDALVAMMVDADLVLAEHDRAAAGLHSPLLGRSEPN